MNLGLKQHEAVTVSGLLWCLSAGQRSNLHPAAQVHSCDAFTHSCRNNYILKVTQQTKQKHQTFSSVLLLTYYFI